MEALAPPSPTENISDQIRSCEKRKARRVATLQEVRVSSQYLDPSEARAKVRLAEEAAQAEADELDRLHTVRNEANKSRAAEKAEQDRQDAVAARAAKVEHLSESRVPECAARLVDTEAALATAQEQLTQVQARAKALDTEAAEQDKRLAQNADEYAQAAADGRELPALLPRVDYAPISKAVDARLKAAQA